MIMENNNIKKWREVPFAKNYLISSDGSLYSRKYKRELNPRSNKKGYKVAYIKTDSDGYKSFFIHRIVAITFLENHESLKIVNHIDSNPLNNSVENLEWCTSSHNNKHGIEEKIRKGKKINSAKATIEQVLTMFTLRNHSTHRDIAKAFNLEPSTVGCILRGKTWLHHTRELL